MRSTSEILMQVAAVAEHIGYGQLKCQQQGLVVVTGGSSAGDHLSTIRPVLSGFLHNTFRTKNDLLFRKLRNPTSKESHA